MKRRRRVWIKSTDGFKVYEDPPSEDNERHFALYDEGSGDIEVVTNSQDVMEIKLCHELCHKAFHGMSTEDATRVFGDVYESELNDQQEELCLYLEKTLFSVLRRNGWLKFPKPPSHKARKK